MHAHLFHKILNGTNKFWWFLWLCHFVPIHIPIDGLRGIYLESSIIKTFFVAFQILVPFGGDIRDLWCPYLSCDTEPSFFEDYVEECNHKQAHQLLRRFLSVINELERPTRPVLNFWIIKPIHWKTIWNEIFTCSWLLCASN